MSQHDMDIANASGASVRSDVNLALKALASTSSGASEPGTMFAYQWWADTTNGLLKQRNAANNAWLVRATLAETFVLARSSNTILGVGDFGRCFVATSSFTQTLTAAATLGDGWYVDYRNDGTGIITIDPNSSETIDGAATMLLQPGEAVRIWCNGSAFKTTGRSTGMVFLATAAASSSSSLDFTNLTGYSAYLFIIQALKPATDAAALWARFSTDNGATFDSSASYAYASAGQLNGTGYVSTSSDSDSKAILQSATSNGAGLGIGGQCLLQGTSGHDLTFQTVGRNETASGQHVFVNNGGAYYNAGTPNAMRFMFSTGNIVSGTIRCYGIR